MVSVGQTPSPEGIPNDKTGTVATVSMHIFCAVVGAGVLALPQSVAWLGWVAGPILITVFYGISLMSSKMLAECYETDGIEHARYHHAVRHILSARSAFFVSLFQLLNIFLTTIAYTITGATSMQQIAILSCNNSNPDECTFATSSEMWKLILIFGATELFFSQVRNLEEAWWVSMIGTVGSFIYSLIALVISVSHVSNGGGTVEGIKEGEVIYGGDMVTKADKIFSILNALGAIAFAYNFSLILLEIQDTLKQPPRAANTMKKACSVAITSSFVFYLAVAVAGYAAEGNQVAGMVLESFDGPKWALIIANLAVLAHMVTAFQVYAQAMFNTLESHIKWWQIQKFIKKVPGVSSAVPVPAAKIEGAEKGDAPAPPMPTPFDAPAGSIAENNLKHDIKEGKKMLGMYHVKLEPLAERLSSVISGQITDPRLSSLLDHLHSEEASLAKRDRMLVRSSMFAVDTGLANEEVPLNEDEFYVPLVWRIIIRSLYVLIITVLSACLPFFSAMAGLVGAVTFWPLAIHFPFSCYRKVAKISPAMSTFMWIVYFVLLVVAVAATVGSMRSIVVAWSSYKIFG